MTFPPTRRARRVLRRPGLRHALRGALCGSPLPGPGRPGRRGFEATGEVFFDAQGSGTSVAFSDFRMVGPRVNMTRADDGSWRGNVGDREMILKVQPGRITGDGVDLYVVKKPGTVPAVSIQGMYFQRQVWFMLKAGEIEGTTYGGSCSFDWNPCQGSRVLERRRRLRRNHPDGNAATDRLRRQPGGAAHAPARAGLDCRPPRRTPSVVVKASGAPAPEAGPVPRAPRAGPRRRSPQRSASSPADAGS